MVKLKTKTQKKQDKKAIKKAANKCRKVLMKFIKTLYEYELDISCMSMGLINEINECANDFNHAKERLKEKYTFTDYEDDYSNATHIHYYK